MIPCSTPLVEREDWQNQLSQSVTDPFELLKLLDLESYRDQISQKASQEFPLRVTQSFISRIEKGNRRDPLLLQILPELLEEKNRKDFSADPLKEQQQNPLPGLLHKYQGRVLLTFTACAIHCRYCFRRHFPYQDNSPGKEGWQKVFEYIENNPSITEVILSGGDPLLVSDDYLQQFIQRLNSILHVKRIRFHSRIPIVLPARMTEKLLSFLEQSPKQIILVTHCNHPQEIDKTVQMSLLNIRNSKITLLNQSVLLKHVNDQAAILAQLSERLFNAGVLPYYLHLLDKVQGTSHFYVPKQKARALMRELSCQLPGYLVPKLVEEKAFGLAKKLISF